VNVWVHRCMCMNIDMCVCVVDWYVWWISMCACVRRCFCVLGDSFVCVGCYVCVLCVFVCVCSCVPRISVL